MNGLQQTLMEHDVKFVRIDGDTKPSDRQLYVQQFQSDPDTRVAILSILAAGVVSSRLFVFGREEGSDCKECLLHRWYFFKGHLIMIKSELTLEKYDIFCVTIFLRCRG